MERKYRKKNLEYFSICTCYTLTFDFWVISNIQYSLTEQVMYIYWEIGNIA